MTSAAQEERPARGPETGVAKAPTVKKAGSGWFTRLFIAHLLCYAPAGIWSVASMPFAIFSVPKEMMLKHDVPAGDPKDVFKNLEVWMAHPVIHAILVRVGWTMLVVFLLLHVASLPWGFGKNEARGKRIFFACMGISVVLGILAGGAGWGYLMTR